MKQKNRFKTIFGGLALLGTILCAQGQKYTSLQSADGRTIKAEIVTLSGDSVVVRRSDGQSFKIPLSSLTPDTVQRIRIALPAPLPTKCATWRELIDEFCGVSATKYIESSRTALTTLERMGDTSKQTTTAPLFKETKSNTTIADIIKIHGKPDFVEITDEGTRRPRPSSTQQSIYFWGPLFFKAPSENSKPVAMGIDWDLFKLEGVPYCINTLGMTFIPVEGTDVLWCMHETRVKDYSAYAAANPGVNMEWKDFMFERGHQQTIDHPVINVNWEDAKAFCAWLSQKEGRTYRLPTDHEWSIANGIAKILRENPNVSPEEKDKRGMEHDARFAVYPWGRNWPPPKGYGNYSGFEYISRYRSAISGYEDQHAYTAPVGSYQATNGLFDLSGNVSEWCEDWYSDKREERVQRGADWSFSSEGGLRSSSRWGNDPKHRSRTVGFRCVVLPNR